MKKMWERIIPLSKLDRSFDLEFWQAQTAKMRFRITFEMLKDFYRIKGKRINAHTFRLQRTIENLKQAQG
ncbi:MAG: hypothetical protein NC898_00795 [Candidatus Omnitrophica bacterium]|nr:hypothetical protein [Candidatus Omnitrophota bacterium]MCM8792994.1 hypothetical protein [Candidatus Omnitrophota bacterium]